jgi:hypothetical protein
LILNNFKRLVALTFCCPNSIGGEDFRDHTDIHNVQYKKNLFKSWDNILTCIWGGGTSYMYYSMGNWPTMLTGYLSQVNDATIALPKLADEEAFLNNDTFLYGGRNDLSRAGRHPGSGGDWSQASSGFFMVLGSGDTPPTKDDYKLESWIPTADLSVESYSGVGPHNEWPPLKMCSLTTVFRNNTEENITVKEVGICFAIGKTGSVQKYILLVRDVLQNPVIIKPDEITSFTVVMK